MTFRITNVLLIAFDADQVLLQPFSTHTYPAGLAGGIARNQGMVRHVPGDHGPDSHKSITADSHSADKGADSSEGSMIFDQGVPDLVHLADGGSGIEDIGKHHTWPAEDTLGNYLKGGVCRVC